VKHGPSNWWWPPALALVAIALCAPCVLDALSMPVVERIPTCTPCHGADGNSRIKNMPSLAGQPEFFLLNQLILMREGVRRIEAMAPFVKDLTDADAEALAKHFNKLAPQPSGEPIDPALVERGAKLATQRRCGSCHLPTLAGQDQMPRLAKQRIDYLILTLKSYRDGPRPGADTAMSAGVAGLTDPDLAALAHYAASR
jgi:cytochrome c553